MKLIGIIVGAAILSAAPLSFQCTPKKTGLYIDEADARVVYRRRIDHSYYKVPHHGAGSYPRPFARGYPAPYGVVPYPYSSGPPNLWGGFSGGYR